MFLHACTTPGARQLSAHGAVQPPSSPAGAAGVVPVADGTPHSAAGLHTLGGTLPTGASASVGMGTPDGDRRAGQAPLVSPQYFHMDPFSVRTSLGY